MEPTVTEASTDDGGSPSRGAWPIEPYRAHPGGTRSIVVGLVIGGLIGWQVEKKRVEDDVANVRPIGTITAVGDDSFTVKLRTSSETHKSLDRRDKCREAEDATAAISPRSRASSFGVPRNSDGDLQAREVVVLPDTPRPAAEARPGRPRHVRPR